MRSSFLLLLAISSSSVMAVDWPTFRGNATRSGFTSENIPNQLRERWQFRLPAAPRPAWPTSDRMEYDLAFQPIIVTVVAGRGGQAWETAQSPLPFPLVQRAERLLWFGRGWRCSGRGCGQPHKQRCPSHATV